MPLSTIEIDENEQILYVCLNRPEKRNAINGQMVMELLETLDYYEQNKHLGVLVVRGAGSTFCAGMDIAEMHRIASAPAENLKQAYNFASLMRKFDTTTKPILAVAHGPVMAGGVGILATCDFVVATQATTFCISEASIGMIPYCIAPYLEKKIGNGQLLRMFMTGDKLCAHDAKLFGLVHELFEDGISCKSRIEMMAEQMSGFPVEVLMAGKKYIKSLDQFKGVEDDVTDRYLASKLAEIRTTEVAQNKLVAFLNR